MKDMLGVLVMNEDRVILDGFVEVQKDDELDLFKSDHEAAEAICLRFGGPLVITKDAAGFQVVLVPKEAAQAAGLDLLPV